MVTRTKKSPTSRNKTGSGGMSPATHLGDRHARLRAAMLHYRLDCLVVSNPRDVGYLIGLPGDDSYLVVTARKAIVITDSRYEELLASVTSWADMALRRGPMAEKLGEVVKRLKCGVVGLQSDHLTVDVRKAIARAVGARQCRDTSGILAHLRKFKDEGEIRALQRAVEIAQDAVKAVLADLRIGQTELELSARLKYEMEVRGATGPAFGPIVAACANGSKPHYYPTARARVRAGKPLLIDWGAIYNDYRSDLTRTWSVGRMSRKIREIYQIVLDAQLAAIDAIRPGAKCLDVDAAARTIIAAAGYGDTFGHGLGHGIGLDVHELPSLGPRAAVGDVLEPGMVVTVEPGIYLPGVGGVRIEDDVVVTPNGHRVLSDMAKDLGSATLGV